MLAPTLLLAAAMAQTQVAQTDCAAAMARGMSAATTQICLAETELARGETAQKDGQEWRRHIEAAATLYKRSLGLRLTRSSGAPPSSDSSGFSTCRC
jgi:hypothetical protein